MATLEIKDGVSGYQDLIHYVIRNGNERYPRGIETRDVGPLTVIMHDVTHSLPLGIGRKVNRRIAAAEAIQLIGGFSDPGLTVNASANFKQFMEPEGYFYGAYGHRIGWQLLDVVRKLRADRDSRQAVVTLWNAMLDNVPGKRDYPCTIGFNFAVVDYKLEMNVIMRSQDVWLGTPYDWFQFTQLQQTVAGFLDIKPGVYRHTTWSTHLYRTNFDSAAELLSHPLPAVKEWQPRGITGSTVHAAMVRARELSLPNFNLIEAETDSERWYGEHLAPKLG